MNLLRQHLSSDDPWRSDEEADKLVEAIRGEPELIGFIVRNFLLFADHGQIAFVVANDREHCKRVLNSESSEH